MVVNEMDDLKSSDKTPQPPARAILNCGVAPSQVDFSFECPLQWAAMEPTDDPRQRHCTSCARKVYWCHDAIEAGIRADQGECIAVPAWLVRGLQEDDESTRRIIVGMIPATSERIKAVTTARRELDEDQNT